MKFQISFWTLVALFASSTFAQTLGSEITYQGHLEDGGEPATGIYDFEFLLYDAATGGTTVAPDAVVDDLEVAEGLINAELDFGDTPYVGDQLWIEVRVRDGASSGGYTQLLPRQKMTASPFALYAESVGANSIMSGQIANNSVMNADLANGSVTTLKLADGAVTRDKVEPGAIGPQQLDPLGDYSVTGLTVADGSFIVESGQDILIYDDFNGFRWYSEDGSTQFLSVTTRQTDSIMTDNPNGNTIFHSNAGGVGIGTATKTAGYEVTVPNLSVLGQLDMGYERIAQTYTMDTAATACDSHGNLPCWYGSTTVSCSVGKRVLGGGTTGVTPRYGAMGQSYPSSISSWTCATSYDIADSSRTCYAICARVD